jgi:thiol-disulfide isomerase/thioredoxin
MRLFFIPMIAVGLAVVLLLGVKSSAHTSVEPDAQPLPVQRSTYTPAAAQPAVAQPPSSAPRTAGYVALVDNELILRAEFERVQAIDLAMSTLLGIDPAAPAQLLQQMVNHRLVMRETVKAHGEPGDAPPRLAELLAANGKTRADLDEILKSYAIDPAQFQAYLAELVLVDQFAHAAAVSKGTTGDAYVAALQAAARIHLGDPLTASTPITAPVTATALNAPTPAATAPPGGESLPVVVEDEKRGVAVGQLAPLFELETLADSRHPTAFANLLGKPTVLSFWTTWCPYCLRQTPIMVAGAARYAQDNVQFIGIDVAEKPDVAVAYVAQHAIPYPILLDSDGRAAAAYAVNGYPTTYFLDANGRIVFHQIGAVSEQELTQYVEQLLDAH